MNTGYYIIFTTVAYDNTFEVQGTNLLHNFIIQNFSVLAKQTQSTPVTELNKSVL